ncbi:Spc98 family-domain-containing protein [Trametes meyenii]|nr:Spc98 family-domain-containing protein [Trametes meyenii]
MSFPGPFSEELTDIFEDASSLHGSLPELPPQFFIPRLSDKPQNPIMDTLRLIRGAQPSQHAKSIHLRLPLELEQLSEDVARSTEEGQLRLENLWQAAATEKHGRKSQVLSWDALRPSYNRSITTPSPFLSEQPCDAFASARYYLRPPVQDPNVHLVYAHVPELLDSLLSTVSGASSHFHIWDPAIHKFVLRDLECRERGQIVIVSKDEVTSNSLLQRFLTIGNLVRRLEILADSREAKYSTPVAHAFTHCLSSILAYIREVSETIPSRFQISSWEEARLTAWWVQYEDIELILKALAALCGREEDALPSDYSPVPPTPTALLSSIYDHLSNHIERSSPRIVCAVLAFTLTTTSRSYFQSLCASVGYNIAGSTSLMSRTRTQVPSDWPRRPNEDGEDTNVLPEDPDGDMMDGYPDFIPTDVAEVLNRARKSLVLLRAADSGHPLLNSSNLHQEIGWVWTEEQIDNAVEDTAFGGTLPQGRKTQTVDEDSSHLTPDPNVLDAFKVFDLSPGESLSKLCIATPNILSNAYVTTPLRTFLASFPATLPSSTPTLAHLTTHTLSPLVSHASALSGAFVAHLLTPTTPLHLYTHLELLCGYLLLTSHAFKWRLQDALFSDAEEVDAPVVGSRAYAAREARENARERKRTGTEGGRSRSRATSSNRPEKAKVGGRAIGLSPALTVGDRWPPGGTDLNFHLRTVIVDSLEEGRSDDSTDDEIKDGGSAKAQRRIMEEAEWRLGFAIRDLPVGTGKEKWLNPLAIEALDFLYMHYQPPHPLDVVITPAILSKYHRMFAFNLRLMRVDNTVRTLFRLTRKASAPLFPTLTPTNKRLLHFRFVVHAFITSLSSYVYDVAIGSNMDAFLSRLISPSTRFHPADADPRSLRTSALGHGDGECEPAGFADVFGLAEHHSRVLDEILSSCLLRSGQKAVGDILRQCMELVLELGILAGDLKDGRLEEYEAAPALEELWDRYRAKMTTFVKVLKALVEKEADSSGLVLGDIPLHMMQGHKRISGTTANLHQLLLRFNMSEWWTK